MAATNSSGGVMGKMISPQNISTGVATTELKGKEGVVFARTFKHSILLTVLLGVLVWLQQNVLHVDDSAALMNPARFSRFLRFRSAGVLIDTGAVLTCADFHSASRSPPRHVTRQSAATDRARRPVGRVVPLHPRRRAPTSASRR